MRALIVIVVIVLVMALIGWISFNRDAERPGVNLETQKMKDDTQQALDAGSDLLRKAERSLENGDKKTDAPAPTPMAAPGR